MFIIRYENQNRKFHFPWYKLCGKWIDGERIVKYVYERELNGLRMYELTFNKDQAKKFNSSSYESVRGVLQAATMLEGCQFFREDV